MLQLAISPFTTSISGTEQNAWTSACRARSNRWSRRCAPWCASEIIPLEAEFEAEIGKDGNRWAHTKRQTEIIEGLKAKAREQGLWNFWLTKSKEGYGLNTVEYAYLAEEMGWSRLAPETFNCMAPDTGNMEVLERYGSPEHKEKWLKPLLEGKIRSAYIMTEPGVASSDATNLAMDAKLEGDEWV